MRTQNPQHLAAKLQRKRELLFGNSLVGLIELLERHGPLISIGERFQQRRRFWAGLGWLSQSVLRHFLLRESE